MTVQIFHYLHSLPLLYFYTSLSALYVIDLARFRTMGAGDKLRQQYHQLSADPHSLSNLDQDLPNNMIHRLPIFSLPQEWLWCETWCSDASKGKAKTIDLVCCIMCTAVVMFFIKNLHNSKESWLRMTAYMCYMVDNECICVLLSLIHI